MSAKTQTEVRRQPEQKRSRAGVRAILDATAELLGVMGIDQITTTEIAKRAGLSKAALYRYFPTKMAVVRALAQREFELQQIAIAANLSSDRDLDELLSEGLREYLLSHRAEPYLAQLRAIIRADPELSQLDIGDSRANAETLRAFMVDRGVADDGRLGERILLILDLTDSVVRLVTHADSTEGDRLVDAFVRMAVRELFPRDAAG